MTIVNTSHFKRGNQCPVNNKFVDQYGFYDSATMPIVSTVPQEFYNEYIEKFTFFSSNACLFYLQTYKARDDCPTGNVLCGYNENGENDTLVSVDLPYKEALKFCQEQNANLSKYPIIIDNFSGSSTHKVGCVFLMIISPKLRMLQYRDGDHRDYALYVSI